MGLFSLTKKPEEKKQELPPKPASFLQFPRPEEHEMPEFPAYEPSIHDIKKEITKPEDFDIPVRENSAKKSLFAAESPQQQFSVKEERTEPARFSPPSPDGKTLFVKIERYKEAMHDIHNLKLKMAEAEKILANLEEIKAEEDSKLSRWNSELQSIKEKLLSIDKNLFEA